MRDRAWHMHWFRSVNGDYPSTVVWWLGRCRCGATKAVKQGYAYQPLPREFRTGVVIRG